MQNKFSGYVNQIFLQTDEEYEIKENGADKEVPT